jgi:hypothetical protein
MAGGFWAICFFEKNVFEGQMVATDGGPAPGKARTDAGAFGTRRGNGFVPKKNKKEQIHFGFANFGFRIWQGAWFLRFWIF